MRLALLTIAALALCATPAVAQGKTKSKESPSVAVLETCETFARGDVLAVEAARSAGWDAYENTSETPFVKSYAASKSVPGIGEADLFSLVEDYPGRVFGYCRVDFQQPEGGNGLVQAIVDLPRYQGETRDVDGGLYASLEGVDLPDWLLLTHRNADNFVIQLSINSPKAASEH